jgi:hypothetical protein
VLIEQFDRFWNFEDGRADRTAKLLSVKAVDVSDRKPDVHWLAGGLD